MNEITDAIKYIKEIIHQKGLCPKVMEYVSVLQSFRMALTYRNNAILRACEQRRSELHTEILRDLGCKSPDTRKCCSSCPTYKYCLKSAFCYLIESKHEEICGG